VAVHQILIFGPGLRCDLDCEGHGQCVAVIGAGLSGSKSTLAGCTRLESTNHESVTLRNIPRMKNEKVDPVEIAYLADRAVNELIEDAASGRIQQNRELAEIIIGCICDTAPRRLETLKGLLNQRALERPDLERKHPDFDNLKE
jgi:hypothetical protein